MYVKGCKANAVACKEQSEMEPTSQDEDIIQDLNVSIERPEHKTEESSQKKHSILKSCEERAAKQMRQREGSSDSTPKGKQKEIETTNHH